MAIRIAMLAAECEPLAKTGGLADVVDALARALGRLPEAKSGTLAPVDVFLPRYRSVPVPEDAEIEPVFWVPNPMGKAPVQVRVINVKAHGYWVRLLDIPAAFDRDEFYDHPDDAWRFAVFCRAALAVLRRDELPIDVLHIHDWHTAPVLLERARADMAKDPFFARTAVLVTLHNLAYHGWVPTEKLDQLGLQPSDRLAGRNPDGLDLLLTAIERSELVNTVSPGFAAEAITPEFGMGLHGALAAVGDRFFGILNGIDPEVWDPATDPALAGPYERDAIAGKEACRADLLKRVRFDPQDNRLVVGMIGRLDPQKGFDLLADAAPALLADGCRIIVQGSGHPRLADRFRDLAAADPRRVALIERFDRDMARRIYAGADVFLMPSRFEPCGQGQMISMRYGTPPIVRRTGGLADSVLDQDERPAAGNGFVFDEALPEALAATVRRAARLRTDDPAEWAALVYRAMSVDFRWDTGAAPKYLEAYRRAFLLRKL